MTVPTFGLVRKRCSVSRSFLSSPMGQARFVFSCFSNGCTPAFRIGPSAMIIAGSIGRLMEYAADSEREAMETDKLADQLTETMRISTANIGLEKPSPCSPARAASIDALSASRCVCSAKSALTSVTWLIRSTCCCSDWTSRSSTMFCSAILLKSRLTSSLPAKSRS